VSLIFLLCSQHLPAQPADAQAQPALHVGQDVALGVVGLVEGECLATHGHAHIIRHALRDDVFDGLAAPVGEDLVAQFLNLLRRDVEAILRPCGQDLQLAVDPVHRTLRGNHAHARQQRAVADDQLVRLDGDAEGARQMQQHLAAAQGDRLALGLAVALGGETRPLHVDLAFVLQQPVFDARRARRRARALPFVARKAACGIGNLFVECGCDSHRVSAFTIHRLRR
jgi:hypothetical protein